MVGILEGEYLGILELDCTGRSQYGPWSFLVLLAWCALVSMVQHGVVLFMMANMPKQDIQRYIGARAKTPHKDP